MNNEDFFNILSALIIPTNPCNNNNNNNEDET